MTSLFVWFVFTPSLTLPPTPNHWRSLLNTNFIKERHYTPQLFIGVERFPHRNSVFPPSEGHVTDKGPHLYLVIYLIFIRLFFFFYFQSRHPGHIFEFIGFQKQGLDVVDALLVWMWGGGIFHTTKRIMHIIKKLL